MKQIVGSTLRDAAAGGAERPLTNFETDRSAAEYAALYRADALEGGHVVLLSPDPASRAAARAALAAYPGGLQVGGGVTAANAREWLDAGASHVVVTSYVFRDGGLDEERLQELVRRAPAAAARAGAGAGSDDTNLFDGGGARIKRRPRQSMRRKHETLGY